MLNIYCLFVFTPYCWSPNHRELVPFIYPRHIAGSCKKSKLYFLAFSHQSSSFGPIACGMKLTSHSCSKHRWNLGANWDKEMYPICNPVASRTFPWKAPRHRCSKDTVEGWFITTQGILPLSCPFPLLLPCDQSTPAGKKQGSFDNCVPTMS